MTWIRPTLAAFALATTLGASTALANESIMPQTLTVELYPSDPENDRIGELIYRGGVTIEPGDEEIGGVSGLEWWGGELYAVTDDGRWLIMAPDAFRDQLVDVIEIEFGPLLDERGKKLKRKDEAAPASIARNAAGELIVAFKSEERVWRYPNFTQPAQAVDATDATIARRLDAIAAAATAERGSNQAMGASCASTGVCYVLFRQTSPDGSIAAEILAVGEDGMQESLAAWAAPLTVDSFEGLAVREEGPKTYLYIISNSHQSDNERTLLMKFEVAARAAAAPGVPEKVYETTRVILETAMGEITVALETERAPITAANFLRYIDEDRYDGTKCYRAMQHKQLDEPSGFLQCGTQNHPDRILPGIAHEPTNETGLSHTDGALSMARFDPGTATGDFSIMIRDQIGLDAQPNADDPALRPGFAVFGYVVDGMDVVHAIHATPVDPDAGEGFLKGQMLAEPITIVNVRRAETDSE